jgi:hypothetical protein
VVRIDGHPLSARAPVLVAAIGIDEDGIKLSLALVEGAMENVSSTI